MDMNLYQMRLELIQWLTTIDDKELIEKIFNFKKQESKDWWNNISEKEKESIEKGLKDIENGKTKPHHEVRKTYEKWL